MTIEIPNYVVGIDLGTLEMGCSIFFRGRPTVSALFSTKGDSWFDRQAAAAKELVHWVMVKGGVDVVVIELPEVWQGKRGTVAQRTGSMMKLSWLGGEIAARFRSISEAIEIVPVTVNEWKGQLPKDIICRFINKEYGTKFDVDTTDNNVADATAIAHWYVAKLKGKEGRTIWQRSKSKKSSKNRTKKKKK
jgi:hypothetical protein